MSDLNQQLFNTAVQFAGSSLNAAIASGNSRAQRKWSTKEAEKARQFEVEMWDKANQYNLPSAQMQRLKDANLNPYLMYGNGASGLAQAGVPNGAQASSAGQAVNSDFNFLQGVHLSNETRLTNAEVERKAAETKKILSDTVGQDISNEINSRAKDYIVSYKMSMPEHIRASIDALTHQAGYTGELTNKVLYDINHLMPAQLEKIGAEIDKIKADTSYTTEAEKYISFNAQTGRFQAQAAMYQAQTAHDMMKIQQSLMPYVASNLSAQAGLNSANTSKAYTDMMVLGSQMVLNYANVSKSQQEAKLKEIQATLLDRYGDTKEVVGIIKSFSDIITSFMDAQSNQIKALGSVAN